jgi:hypothetical protein
LQALPFGRDQAQYAVAAREIGDGSPAGAVAWSGQPAGMTLWMLAARRLAGPLEDDARRAEWLWMTLAALALAMAAAEWSRQPAAAIPAAVIFAMHCTAGGFTRSLQPAGLALLPLIAAFGFWGPAGENRTRSRAAAAGLALGVAALFAAAATWAAVVCIACEKWRPGAERPRVGRDAALLIAFLLAVPALFVAGAFTVGQATAYRALVPTFAALGFSRPASYSGTEWLTVLLLAGLVWRTPRRRAAAVPLLLSALGFALCAEAFGWPGDRALLFGPLAIGAGVIVAEIAARLEAQTAGNGANRVAAVAVTAVLLFLSPWAGARRQWTYFRFYLAGANIVDRGRVFVDPDTSFSYPAVRAISGVLQRRARGRWRAFVWGAEPGLWHYSGLKPFDNYWNHAALLRADEWARQDFLGRFRAAPPEFVVIRKNDRLLPQNGGRRDSQAALAEFPSFAAALDAEYRLIVDRLDFLIYLRRDLLSPAENAP